MHLYSLVRCSSAWILLNKADLSRYGCSCRVTFASRLRIPHELKLKRFVTSSPVTFIVHLSQHHRCSCGCLLKIYSLAKKYSFAVSNIWFAL